MKCKTARFLVSEDLSRNLSSHEVEGLEEHVAGCESCRQLRDGMQDAVTSLRGLPVDEPPLDLWERVKQRLPESPKRRWAWVPLFPSRRQTGLGVPVALAAATAVAFVLFRPLTQAPQQPEPQPQLHTQVQDSSLYLQQCVEEHVTYGGDRLVGEQIVLVANGDGYH